MAEHQNELAVNLDGNVIDFVGRVLSKREPPASDDELAEYRRLLPQLRLLAEATPDLLLMLAEFNRLKGQTGCPAMRHILSN